MYIFKSLIHSPQEVQPWEAAVAWQRLQPHSSSQPLLELCKLLSSSHVAIFNVNIKS